MSIRWAVVLAVVVRASRDVVYMGDIIAGTSRACYRFAQDGSISILVLADIISFD